jgi:hypothetical protein
MASTTGAKVAIVDLEKTTSRESHTNEPPPELLANEADAELLFKLEIQNYNSADRIQPSLATSRNSAVTSP